MSKVTIMTFEGPREVDAIWQKGGLAVHRAVSGYAITQVATGFAVVRGRLESVEAIIMANELLEVGDWNRSTTEIVADREFYHAVWKVIGRGRERGNSGMDPEKVRLAMYASDCDTDVMRTIFSERNTGC